MIADSAHRNPQYQSIPPAYAAIHSPGHAQHTPISRRFPSTPSPRRLRLLVGVALFVAALAFLARRADVLDHTHHTRLFPALPRLRSSLNFDLFRHYDSRTHADQLHANVVSLGLDGFSRRAPYTFVRSHESSSSSPDFILDEMVPTAQCSENRYCKARLIVERKDGQVVVKAGYYIFTNDGVVRSVDSSTKARIEQTTPAQAQSWATKLLDSVGSKLDDVKCSVTVEVVAQAILDATETAATCPQTDDALCDASLPVKQCAPPTASGPSVEDDNCAGNSTVLDEKVPTGQCSYGLYCRATLLVESEDGQVVVKAGYHIFWSDGEVRSVDSSTKARIEQTTPAQAQSWATKLLDNVGNKLDDVKCSVTVEMVAQAILDAAETVVTCPQTGDALCNASVPVKQCADANCGGDCFVLDEMVPTRQCSVRRLCRARLVVQKKGGQVVVKAGYYIYTPDGTVRNVDSWTKRRIAQTTRTQAQTWAATLLASVGSKLDDVKCSITDEMVAQAILDAAKTVVTCPQTGDALCDASVPVKKCAPPTAGGLSVEGSHCASNSHVLGDMVPTAQCSPHRFCRARVIVEDKDGQVVVKAGYFIFTRDGTVRTVDPATKQRIGQTTSAQAQYWATQLLRSVGSKLDVVKCSVTVEKVAQAILDAAETVVTCPQTGDALCDASVPVKQCAAPTASVPSMEVNSCESFVRSTSAGALSFAQLQEKCPSAQFFYNRVGVSLPLCKATCAGPTDVEHTVFMDFFVQVKQESDAAMACAAALLPAVYNVMHPNIPVCGEVEGEFERFSKRFFYTLGDSNDGKIPKQLTQIAQNSGCGIAYVFFTKSGFSSMQQIIKESCNSNE